MTKLMYGIGYNSRGTYRASKNRKSTKAYITWADMIKRCYSSKYHENKPTYIDCSVDERWHDFQDFAKWFYNHDFSNMGYQLDKDLLIPKNKAYNSEACSFVPRELNMLLVSCGNARGKYPQGVYFQKASGKYMSAMRTGGERMYLGYFNCPQEAYQVYKKAKEAHVKTKALEWKDRIADDVFTALMNWQL